MLPCWWETRLDKTPRLEVTTSLVCYCPGGSRRQSLSECYSADLPKIQGNVLSSLHVCLGISWEHNGGGGGI